MCLSYAADYIFKYSELQISISPSCGHGYTNSPQTQKQMNTHLENCVLLWRQIVHEVLWLHPWRVLWKNNKTKRRCGLVFYSLCICVKGTVRARAAVWTALDTRVPQTQPRKGNHHDFWGVHAQTPVHIHTYGVKKTEHRNKRNLFACLSVMWAK